MIPDPYDDVDVFSLSETAIRVRNAYIAQRSKRDTMLRGVPSRYVPSKKWDGDTTGRNKKQPVWNKIAEYVNRNKLNPELLVAVLFEVYSSQTPMPNMVTTETILRAYREGQLERLDWIRQSLNSEQTICEMALGEVYSNLEMTEKDCWIQVLFDTSNGLSPLIRVCLAYKLDIPAVVDKFIKAAIMQYIPDKEAYDKHWRSVIPEEFEVNGVTWFNQYTA